MFLTSIDFIGRRVCHHRRRHAAPEGYAFCRNYKRQHRARIEETLDAAELTAHAVVAENACDERGQWLPEKIAVYFNSDHAAGLFFQFYARAKTERRRISQASVQRSSLPSR